MHTQDQMAVETGAGNVFCDRAVVIHIDEIGEDVEATVLEDATESVRVLTVGRRCAEQGFEFTWRPFAPAPELYRPDRRRCDVKVDEDYVPYVESKPGRRGSSRAAKKLFVTVVAADSDVPAADSDAPEDAEAVRPLDEEISEINIVDDVTATDLEIVGQIARLGGGHCGL